MIIPGHFHVFSEGRPVADLFKEKMMITVADCSIPFVEESFSGFGPVVQTAGRALSRDKLTEADMLLVRSVTRVDEKLLRDTPVKFVGTATIGIDHIDVGYLRQQGIGFAAAPGSNAQSVAEYVVCALVSLCRALSLPLQGKTLGIIGHGNVGSRVAVKAQALGMRCLINDPPLQRTTGNKCYVPLDEVLQKADAVTLHVPLTLSGQDATLSMANEAFFRRMKPGAIFINTSRGRVVSEAALRACRKSLAGVILDVWENEPALDARTLDEADIATPHIAGYSFDGKVNGTRMIYKAACDFFGRPATWTGPSGCNNDTVVDVRESPDPVAHALQSTYPLMDDDGMLRKISGQENKGAYFDHLRATYRRRLEFEHFVVQCSKHQSTEADMLEHLGFRVRREE